MLSKNVHETLEMFYHQYRLLVKSLQCYFLETKDSLFFGAIQGSDVPLDSCAGLIDAANIYIARSREPLQRASFSGHKRHALKVQAISLLNGLVLNIRRRMEK